MKISPLFLVFILVLIVIIIIAFVVSTEEPMFNSLGKKHCLYLHRSKVIDSDGSLVVKTKHPHELHIIDTVTKNTTEVYTDKDYMLPAGKVYITRISFWDVNEVRICKSSKKVDTGLLSHERKDLETVSQNIYDEFVNDDWIPFRNSIFSTKLSDMEKDFRPVFFNVSSFTTTCHNSVLLVVKDNDFTKCNITCLDSNNRKVPLPSVSIVKDSDNVRTICIPFTKETNVIFDSSTANNASPPYYVVFSREKE